MRVRMACWNGTGWEPNLHSYKCKTSPFGHIPAVQSPHHLGHPPAVKTKIRKLALIYNLDPNRSTTRYPNPNRPTTRFPDLNPNRYRLSGRGIF